MDIPRIFNITESAHASITSSRPQNSPLSARHCVWKRTRVLDLGSGSGEMLCTWARDYGVIGTGGRKGGRLLLRAIRQTKLEK